MADIQIIPTRSPRADMAGEAPTVAGPAGDSGFAALSGLIAGWPGPVPDAGAVPGAGVPGDPLARWLDEQMGISAQFTATPGTDAAFDALAEGLPQLPQTVVLTEAASAWSDQEPVPGPVDVAAILDKAPPMVDAQMSIGALTEPAPETAWVAPIAQNVVAQGTAPVLVLSPQSPGKGSDAVALLGHQSVDPAVVPSDHNHAVAVASLGGRPAEMSVADAHVSAAPTVQAPAATASVAESPDRVAPLAGAERGEGLAPIGARETGPVVRAEIAPPAGLADMLAAHPTSPEPQAAAGSRMTAAGGPAALPEARQVLQQVTDALVTTRSDRTEIALSPEELGRIRLVMSGPDRAQIIIWAERPETLDLVRRNADLLTQQLAEAGVNAGSMEFRRDERADWQAAAPVGTEDDENALPPTAAVMRLTPTSLSDRRLDIRL